MSRASHSIEALLLAAVLLISAMVSGVVLSYPPTQRLYAAMLLAAVGFLISLYVLAYKLGCVPLACPRGKLINCAAVLDSRYSKWFGVPTAAFGLVFFSADALLLAYGAFVPSALLGLAGAVMVVERVHSQASVGRICAYCAAAHIATICLFIASVSLAL